MKCHNVFHISKLQPCHSSTEQPDFIPTTIEAVRDEHVVDHIVEHQISEPNDGLYSRGPALVFKVRWYGYTSAEDTWETYETLRRVSALHDYARSNVSFRNLFMSSYYIKLNQRYPTRFPASIPWRAKPNILCCQRTSSYPTTPLTILQTTTYCGTFTVTINVTWPMDLYALIFCTINNFLGCVSGRLTLLRIHFSFFRK